MTYKVLAIPPFDRQLKRLAKKYPSRKSEFSDLIENLEKEPKSGTYIGNGCFKIRLAIASKGKGKSGGVRVITNFVIDESTIFLISIYDKSEKKNLTTRELSDPLRQVPFQ